MPCVQCGEREAIIARLTAEVQERDHQLSEANAKLAKQKLQSKAKFAQLKHQFLEVVAEKENGETQTIVENLLTKLNETDDQLSQRQNEIGRLMHILKQKDAELIDKDERIGILTVTIDEQRSHIESERDRQPVHSESEDEDNDRLHERLDHMYAQLVYKDSKMVELNDIILERERQIDDLQESCRERDEVIRAKTKAVQIFQEKLNFYANREFRDIATETTSSFTHEVRQQNVSQNITSSPGHAVMVYGIDDDRRPEDEESSVTTEITNTGGLGEKTYDTTDGTPKSTKRTVGLDYPSGSETGAEFPSSNADNKFGKKKKEKKVTFNLSPEAGEESRILSEKLRETEQMCVDWREENENFRMTISDLERQLDENNAHVVELEIDLENALKSTDNLREELRQTRERHERDHEESQSHWRSRLEDLQDKLRHADNEKTQLEKQCNETRDKIVELEESLRRAEFENAELAKQKLSVLSDVDELREAIETSQQMIDSLEDELHHAHLEIEDSRALMDRERRDRGEQTSAWEFELGKQRLSTKAYETKLRSVEKENERLLELINVQKQEWISLRTEDKEELTGVRLKKKAYEAKLRILEQDNGRLEGVLEELKKIIDVLNTEKAESMREYERKISEFEQEAKDNLSLIERAMAEQTQELQSLKNELNSQSKLKTKAYEAKWRSIERENQRLTENVAEITRSLEQKEQDCANLSDQNERFKKYVEELEISKKGLETEMVELRLLLDELERKETEWSKKVLSLEKRLEEKTSECAAATADSSDSDAYVRTLRVENDSMKEQLHQLNEKHRQLTEENSEMELELRKLWDNESALRRRLGEQEATSNRLEADLQLTRVRCSEFETQESSSLEKLAEAEAVAAQLKQHLAKATDRIRSLESSASNNTLKVADELREAKSALSKLQEESRNLKIELSTISQQKNDLIEDKSQLQTAMELLKEEKEQWTTSLAQVQEDLANTEQSFGRCSDELKTLRTRSNEAINEMKVKLADSLNRIEELEMELAQMNETSSMGMSQLQSELDQYRQTKQLLETRIASLESANASLTETSAQFETAICASETEKATLRDRLSELDSCYTAVQQQNSDMADRLQQLQTTLQEQELRLQSLNFTIEQGDTGVLAQSEAERPMLSEQCLVTESTPREDKESSSELYQELREKEEKIIELTQSLQTARNHNEEFRLQLQQLNQLLSDQDKKQPEENFPEPLLDFGVGGDTDSNTSTIEELNVLKLECEKFGEERQSLCAEIIELNQRLDSVNMLNDALKQNVDVLTEELDLLKSTNRTEPAAEKSQETEATLSQNYEQLANYYNQLQAAYVQLFEQYEYLKRRLTDVRHVEVDTDSLRSELLTDSSTNTERSEDTATKDDTSAAERHTPDGSKTELLKWKAKLKKSEKIVEALEGKVRYVQEQNAHLEQQLLEKDEILSQRDVLQHEVDRLNSLVAEVHHASATPSTMETSVVPEPSHHHAQQLNDISSKLEEVTEAKRQMEVAMRNLEGKLRNEQLKAEQRLDEALGQSRGYEQHVLVLTEEIERLKKSGREKEEILTRVEADRQKLKKTTDELYDTCELLREELSQIKQLFQTVDVEKQNFENRVIELQQSENDLRLKLNERVDVCTSLQMAASESETKFNQDLELMKQSQVDMQDQLSAAVLEKDRLQEKIRNLLIINDRLETERYEFESKVELLDQQTAEIQRLANVHQENSLLKEQLQNVRTTMEKWETKASALELDLQVLSSTNAQLAKEKHHLDQQISLIDNDTSLIQTRADAAEEENVLLRSITDELQTKIGGLLEENQRLTEAQATLARVADKQQEIDCLKRDLNILNDELTAEIQQRLAMTEEFSKEKSAFEKILEEKQNSVTHLTSQISQLQKRMEQLMTEKSVDLESAEQKIQTITLLADNLRKKLKETEAALDDKIEICDRLNSELEQSQLITRESFNKKEAELLALLQEKAEKEEALQNDCEFFSNSLSETNCRIQQLESDAKMQEEERKDAMAKLIEERDAIERMLTENSTTFEHRTTELQTALEKATNDLQVVVSEREYIRATYERLYEAYSGAESMKNQADEQMKLFANRLAESEQQWKQKTSELVKQLEDSRLQNDDLRRDTEISSKEIESSKGLRQELEYMRQQLLEIRRNFEEQSKELSTTSEMLLSSNDELKILREAFEQLNEDGRLVSERWTRLAESLHQFGFAETSETGKVHAFIIDRLRNYAALETKNRQLNDQLEHQTAQSKERDQKINQLSLEISESVELNDSLRHELKNRLEVVEDQKRLQAEHRMLIEQVIHLATKTGCSANNSPTRCLENIGFQYHRLQNEFSATTDALSSRLSNTELELDSWRHQAQNEQLKQRELTETVQRLQHAPSSDHWQHQVNEWQSKCNQYSSELEILQSRFADSNEELQISLKNNAESSRQIAELRETLTKAKDHHDAETRSLRDDLSMCKKELIQAQNEKNEEVRRVNVRFQQLESNWREKTNEAERLQADYDAYRSQCADQQHDQLAQLYKEKEFVENDCRMLRRQIDDMVASESALKSELQDYVQQLVASNNNAEELKRISHQTDREMANLRHMIDKQSEELASVKSAEEQRLQLLKSYESEIVHLRENLAVSAEQLQQRAVDLESIQKSAMDERRAADERLFSAESETRNRLEVQFEHRFDELRRSSEAELSRLTTEKQNLIDLLEQESAKYGSSMRQMGELKETLTQYQRQMESVHLKLAELDAYKEKLRELESIIKRQNAEKNELNNQLKTLQQDNERLIATQQQRSNFGNDSLQRSSSSNEGAKESQQPEFSSQSQIQALRRQVQTLETQNRNLGARLREMEKDHKALVFDTGDLEAGNDGETVSLVPTQFSSRRSEDEVTLQLRRETLGSFSRHRSTLASMPAFIKSKMQVL